MLQNLLRKLKERLRRSDLLLALLTWLLFGIILSNFLWSVPIAMFIFLYSKIHGKIGVKKQDLNWDKEDENINREKVKEFRT